LTNASLKESLACAMDNRIVIQFDGWAKGVTKKFTKRGDLFALPILPEYG
jgi:hypothetical protein